MNQGMLYIVPTPIGNLDDITCRGLSVLRDVDLIVCEDTRQTVKLLNHYGIKKPLVSFYTQNQYRRLPEITRHLMEGKKIALVSDSGTPVISDPGAALVAKAVEEGFSVVPLPGPCAAVTALSASGLPSDGFVFLGFLKRKPGKMKKELRAAAAAGKTIVFYESPYRVKKTVSLLRELFPGETPVALARELTKKFEEFIRGTLDEVIAAIAERDLPGEFVVLIAPVNSDQLPVASDHDGNDNGESPGSTAE